MDGTIRDLSADEVTSLVLPLRLDALHHGLDWVHHEVRGPESLRDGYDAKSIHLGYFAGDEFIGAIRLVVDEHPAALPSGRYLPVVKAFVGRSGELCKGGVATEHRGRGVLSRLFAKAFRRAKEEGVRHLILTDLWDLNFYARDYGFSQLGPSFRFVDGHIAPPNPARLFHVEVLPATPGL